MHLKMLLYMWCDKVSCNNKRDSWVEKLAPALPKLSTIRKILLQENNLNENTKLYFFFSPVHFETPTWTETLNFDMYCRSGYTLALNQVYPCVYLVKTSYHLLLKWNSFYTPLSLSFVTQKRNKHKHFSWCLNCSFIV